MRSINRHTDTITAISTPYGVGGIGIIRVSGPLSEQIGRIVFKCRNPLASIESHRLYHGDFISSETGLSIDEVLMTLMRGPHSYTGEDVLEIHCHGGPAILQAVLRETIKAGARPARTGEFTERAYLNGRLDLIQAEAVGDMIHAQSELALVHALSHLKGGLSEKLHALRSDLLDLLAIMEASIDFPEEDLESVANDSPVKLAGILVRIADLLATYREGKMITDGMEVVITGKSNVGKSSLLNCLLGEERAIVTETAGTTRDLISETISIKGIPVRLTDTAGIRDTRDMIEKKGIEMVWEKLDRTDAVILVLDGSMPLDESDRMIIRRISGKKIMVAVNKSDLLRTLSEEDIQAILPGVECQTLSAKYGQGIEELRERLHQSFIGKREGENARTIISNVRHKEALEKAESLLIKARENILNGLSPELTIVDLQDAITALGELIGEATGEDVLERIFSTFCIGK